MAKKEWLFSDDFVYITGHPDYPITSKYILLQVLRMFAGMTQCRGRSLVRVVNDPEMLVAWISHHVNAVITSGDLDKYDKVESALCLSPGEFTEYITEREHQSTKCEHFNIPTYTEMVYEFIVYRFLENRELMTDLVNGWNWVDVYYRFDMYEIIIENY